MRFNVYRNPREDEVLRCVWKPAHSGANAPLTATWIRAPRSAVTACDFASKSAEGGSWEYAA